MTHNDEPVKSGQAPDPGSVQGFEEFMAEMESDTAFLSRKRKSDSSEFEDEITRMLKRPVKIYLEAVPLPPGQENKVSLAHLRSSSASPHTSPFERIEQSETSVSTDDEANVASGKIPENTAKTVNGPVPNLETVAVLKQAMAGHSRLMGTFTALKTTYLKLCKEFNYLLGKFNENERIKIELIHENNELRKLLFETIKEKELDRKQYKAELRAKGKEQTKEQTCIKVED